VAALADGLVAVQGLAGRHRDVVALEDQLVVVVEAVADRRRVAGRPAAGLVQLKPERATGLLPHEGLVVHHILLHLACP